MSLAVCILLLKDALRTKLLSRYIWYMCKYVIFQKVPVIAAAVLAVVKFGAFCKCLLPNILVFLACFEI
jgi:hypothetical protein